ncbi:MAG: hypothetical protein ACREOO_09560 [bacterium]
MKLKITISDRLVRQMDELFPRNGGSSRERTIQKLLRESLLREKQKRVAKLYYQGKKTLRQCAALLNVELQELMEIFCDLGIPLDGSRSPQNDLALKLLQQR